MSVIYLVRHGQASFGSANYDELSPRGRIQARLLGKHFLRIQLPVHSVYAGELKRQVDTAREVLGVFEDGGHKLPPYQGLPEFNEYDSGAIVSILKKELTRENPQLLRDIENPPDRKTFQNAFEEIVARWVSGELNLDGLPRWDAFQERVRRGLAIVRADNGRRKNILVFTSGGPIAVAIQTALTLSDMMTMKMSWQVMNASVTRLIYSEERLILASFNNVSHLELAGDPALLTHR